MSGSVTKLFIIVPEKDGYHFLKLDETGNTYLAHKAEESVKKNTLLFSKEEYAKSYIDNSLINPSNWKVEGMYVNNLFIDEFDVYK